MTEIYFDNAATTRVRSEVMDAVTAMMREDYGNPSSMHRKGVEAENHLRHAAKTIADILKVKEKEVFFTSGGTESNNWAVIGTALANERRGRHIITTQIEHAAVGAPVSYLEERGFEVTRLGTDRAGHVDPAELAAALRDDTVLVSVMFVNNEVGAVQPVAEIGALIRERQPAAFFHTDAVQAFGKLPVLPKRMKIDMLSVSAHKIHGPKGAGFLFVDERVKIDPLIRGGGQQGGMRSGTDNVPGAVGLAKAAEIACEHREEHTAHMRMLRERLAAGFSDLGAVLHAGDAPHILNASFPGVRSEVLLHALEDRGIYVSAGSACSSHKRKPSPTLSAMGCGKEETESALRFSFCADNTVEEADAVLAAIGELLPQLRRFTRK